MNELAVQRLVDAHANTRDRRNAQAIAAVRTALSGFTGWYSDDAVRDMAAKVVARVEATQRLTAATANAYLARVAREVAGRALPTVPIINPATLRVGTDHVEVYERLGVEYRYAVSEGAEPQKAVANTLARGVAMAEMDNLLAFRGQTQRFMQETDGVEGYRRVIRPEQSRGGTCGLCAVASDQIYGSDELLPIHDRCKCDVLPIVGSNDPGRSLNGDELGSLYDAAGSTDGRALKKVRIEIHEHGELGPVLRPAGQHFRGPDEVASAA